MKRKRKPKMQSLVIPVNHLTDDEQVRLFKHLFEFAHTELPDKKVLDVIPILEAKK